MQNYVNARVSAADTAFLRVNRRRRTRVEFQVGSRRYSLSAAARLATKQRAAAAAVAAAASALWPISSTHRQLAGWSVGRSHACKQTMNQRDKDRVNKRRAHPPRAIRVLTLLALVAKNENPPHKSRAHKVHR